MFLRRGFDEAELGGWGCCEMLKRKRFKSTIEPNIRVVTDIVFNMNTMHVTVSGYFEARGALK